MENASKALLIAGSILIAIIILAVLVRSFSTIGAFQNAQLSEEEQAQLLAFNEQYIKYLGQYVYGTEVLSLQNKYDNDHKVEVKFEGVEGVDYEKPQKDENHYQYNQETNSYSNETRYYKCTNITYDESTGRVNSITFKQIKLKTNVESTGEN